MLGWFQPETNPFHTTAVALACRVDKVQEQCLAIALASMLRQYEEVFETETSIADKGGEVVEVVRI